MTRAMLTIYAPFDAWLVKMAEGWRLCGTAPESDLGWTILLWRWEPRQERVAYRGVAERYR